MESKHTSGPWPYPEGEFHETLCFPANRIAHKWLKRLHVANVFGATKDEAEANARLIAAAPDLLKALQRILERPDVNMQFGDDEVFARRAIAKATGH